MRDRPIHTDVGRRTLPRLWLQHLSALAGYSGLSLLLFGLPLLRDFSHMYIRDFSADPAAFMWYFVWWPYALTHGLNPFITRMLWAPTGVNLVWRTSVPGASLLAAPITLASGPVAAYNAVSLLAPPMAAWTAYLLSWQITRRFWPSLAGGYLFGFSSYELSHLFGGHLNLILIFPIPLSVCLVLRRLSGEIPARTFVLALAGTLVLQFLFSTELLATLTLFGGTALLVVLGVAPADVRKHLRLILPLIASAYGLAAVAVSPFLYYAFGHGSPPGHLFSPEVYATDPLNFLVPTPVSLASRLLHVRSAILFSGNITEAGAYLGLPLIAILVLFGLERWRRTEGALLMTALLLTCVASLGPVLHVGGRAITLLPGQLLQLLPLINVALPARFIVYASLAGALIAALWLTSGQAVTPVRWALAALAIVTLLPNVPRSYAWTGRVDTPAFFSRGLYRQYIPRNSIALVIPYDPLSASLLWHAQTGMYFRMATGYTGAVPYEFLRWPIVDAFTCATLIPDYAVQIKAFLAANDVRTVVIAHGTPGPWRTLFSPLGVEPVDEGGVTVYQVPSSLLQASRGLTPLEMLQKAALAQFSALLTAANAYTSGGSHLDGLSLGALDRLQLLPRWGCTTDRIDRPPSGAWLHNRLWAGAGRDGTIGVAISGAFGVLKPLAAYYGGDAEAVYFPGYPVRLAADASGNTPGTLLMVFSRTGFLRAAEKAKGAR